MLTQCPECELPVSDKATACPHCGYPMKPSEKQKKPRKSNKRRPAAQRLRSDQRNQKPQFTKSLPGNGNGGEDAGRETNL